MALGVDYTFVCFGIEDARGGVQAMRTLGIRGLNFTMPHQNLPVRILPGPEDHTV
jgi:shikimate dehydrogenase